MKHIHHLPDIGFSQKNFIQMKDMLYKAVNRLDKTELFFENYQKLNFFVKLFFSQYLINKHIKNLKK